MYIKRVWVVMLNKVWHCPRDELGMLDMKDNSKGLEMKDKEEVGVRNRRGPFPFSAKFHFLLQISCSCTVMNVTLYTLLLFVILQITL